MVLRINLRNKIIKCLSKSLKLKLKSKIKALYSLISLILFLKGFKMADENYIQPTFKVYFALIVQNKYFFKVS